MGRIVFGLALCAIFSGAVGCGMLSAGMRRVATVTSASVPKIAQPEPDIRRGFQQKSAPVDCDELKCVALTFDDGPRKDTARLLKMLDEYNAKATFFVVGKMVEADPSMVEREVAAGHEIGNHSWSHANLAVMSDNAIRSDSPAPRKPSRRRPGSPRRFSGRPTDSPTAGSPRSRGPSICRRSSGRSTRRTGRTVMPSWWPGGSWPACGAVPSC